MRKSIALLFASSVVMMVSASNEGSAITNSMRDCRQFAKAFDYTYYNEEEELFYETDYEIYFGEYEDLPFADIKNVAQNINLPAYYELVTCNFPGICPDGSDAKNQCKWQRFLGLWCLDKDISDSGSVELKIATNSLPNHCYYS